MDIQKQFQEAIKRRNDLKARQERLQGRLEAARSRQQEVQEKCRAKGVDPDNIEELISKVEKVLEERVESITRRVDEAEEQLAPYLEEMAG